MPLHSTRDPRWTCFAAGMVAWAIVALIAMNVAGIGGGGHGIGHGTGLRPLSEAVPVPGSLDFLTIRPPADGVPDPDLAARIDSTRPCMLVVNVGGSTVEGCYAKGGGTIYRITQPDFVGGATVSYIAGSTTDPPRPTTA